MMLGMLWHDNTDRTFEQKVLKCKEYYENKYKKIPAKLMVNINQDVTDIAGLEIIKTKSVMPNHFWIGGDFEQDRPKFVVEESVEENP